MWWVLEVLRPGLDTIWCRGKEEADEFLARTGAKLLRVARVERRCGKRVDDPPEPPLPREGERRQTERELRELTEDWYFDPEVGVDEWEELGWLNSRKTPPSCAA